MYDVCVVGLGYVGLPSACLMANAGLKVLGVDVRDDVVESLNSGRTHLCEAGLDTMVSAAVVSGNLKAATEPEPSGAFVICVPTPVTADHKVDLGAVEDACRTIVPHLARGGLVILESTSPVGTTRTRVAPILEGSGLKAGEDFHLCYCPERVLPGRTVVEIVGNDRLIGGLTRASAERARAIYSRFTSGRLLLTDDLTAEMCKLVENAYRDVNVALANSFARIAEAAGTNVWKVIEYANLHPRVKVLNPGPGVGGHCIPVDPWFLVEAFPVEAAVLRSAREMNDGQAAHVVKRLAATGLGDGSKVALLGAAYKADIDDPRGSPAFAIAREAVSLGMEVAIHDPLVRPGEREGFVVSDDMDACLEGADALVLVTDHAFYSGLDTGAFASKMRGRLVLDCRNCLDHEALRAGGFRVLVLGVSDA